MVDPQHDPVEQCTVEGLGHGVTGGDGLRAQRARGGGGGDTLAGWAPKVCALGGRGGDLHHSAPLITPLLTLPAILPARTRLHTGA